MTLFTTLEPCLMCAGAIPLHQVGRLVYGASDLYGGVSSCFDTLSPYFMDVLSLTEWLGPALSAECDPLYDKIRNLERRNEVHKDCPAFMRTAISIWIENKDII
jgi:tRNA(Arg) A34 adenosine deaminase TadA